LWISSIGLGTYLGHWDEATDRSYGEAIERAVGLGCNLIDSAINYRFQRSERAIGAALHRLFERGRARRDEIIVATKGGYFPFDGEPPRDPNRWVIENVLKPGLARPEDIVDSHCMSPAYLRDQLARSLENLGLQTIDIYYIHNPETQLEAINRDEFMRRIRAAFEFLEGAAGDGLIQFYGVATWHGFRVRPGSRAHLSLSELAGAAREVGGQDNHFKFIQLPHNLAMPEALTSANQRLGDKELSTLEAATELGITVICSASLLQAQLSEGLPPFVGEALRGLMTDAQRAIQFVRSSPGVTSALVGMSCSAHVEENLMLVRVPPAPIENFLKLFSSAEG
jgi:aryl-alcohol dehydrogenase-like predicted oxidoreductase